MKLLLENWKRYMAEDTEDRWEQLGGEENFYNTWAALRFGEEERREITAKVNDMPQEEFDEMLAQINHTIQTQTEEIYDFNMPDTQASAIRFYQVNKWRKEE